MTWSKGGAVAVQMRGPDLESSGISSTTCRRRRLIDEGCRIVIRGEIQLETCLEEGFQAGEDEAEATC